MIRQEEIELVITSQRDVFLKQENGFKYDALYKILRVVE